MEYLDKEQLEKLSIQQLGAVIEEALAAAEAPLVLAEAQDRVASQEELDESEKAEDYVNVARGIQAAKQRQDDIHARLKERRGEFETLPEPKTRQTARVEVGEPGILRDPKRNFRNFGEFCHSVYQHFANNVTDSRLRLIAAASGMQQEVGADGGYTVPPQYSDQIWDGLRTSANSLLSLTDNYTVTGESLTFNANAETSRAVGSQYGAMRSYWIAEAGTITASRPKFRQVKIEPQQLAVLVYATDKLLRNAGPALDQYISRASINTINTEVGRAIVLGDGIGKPRGITLAGGPKVQVTRGTASTFVQLDVANMWARLHSSSMSTAVWLIDQTVIPQLLTMTTPVTNVAGTENVGGFSAMLYNPDRNTLMGRPVLHTEFTQALGTSGDVILWDPKGYVTGTRAGIDSAMSIHVKFTTAETAFRFIFEVDGQPWLQSALTPLSGGDTQTSIVDLS